MVIPSTAPENELIRLVQAGDVGAFQMLLELHAESLYRSSLVMSHDRHKPRTAWGTRVGRTQNRDDHQEFVDNVASWKSNEITAMGADEERRVTMVQFSQEFIHKKFGPFRQEIVIVQRWRDGRVYDESIYVMKLNDMSGGKTAGASWRLVSIVIDGKSQPVDGETFVTSLGDEFTVTQNGVEVMKGTTRTVSDGTPRQQDIEFDRGPNVGQTIRQIIKIEGDTMVVCEGPPGGERPTEFTSESGNGRTLSFWSWGKPADAP